MHLCLKADYNSPMANKTISAANPAMQTLYGIQVNRGLLWDYDFSPEKLQDEAFFIWYLGRLLERGTADEVKRIPHEIIIRYLDRLSIPDRIRRFWNWYLRK